MKRYQICITFIPAIIFILSGCGPDVLDDSELVSWNDHFQEIISEFDGGTENLIIASDTSDVRVARLNYSSEKKADLYYPSDMDLREPRGAVVLVSGDSDDHAKGWFGRALKDTNQYMQWGQVIAEEGMIAVTYELGNPEAALEKVAAWMVENETYLGIDLSKTGFFSINENGCTIGLQTITDGSTRYSGPKPAFSIYYYGMMPLRSKPVYTDVPVLTVLTDDTMGRGITASMEEFNKRVMDEGALITVLSYPEGRHMFDCKEDTPRAREIIQETISFMKNHMD